MDKVKKIFSNVFHFVENAFSCVTKYCTGLYQQYLDCKKQSAYYSQEIVTKQRRFDIQFAIQQDLVFVLSQTNLPTFVQPIHMTGHILPNGYSSTPQGILYRFRMSANSIPSMYVLCQLKNLINRSIQNARNLLYYCDGPVASVTHPSIFYGLSVIDIAPDGAELVLTVITQLV